MKIEWKLNELQMLKKAGICHSFFMDALSRTYRKNKYREWNALGIREAKILGIMFCDETPPQSLFEIFLWRYAATKIFYPIKGDVVLDIGAG